VLFFMLATSSARNFRLYSVRARSGPPERFPSREDGRRHFAFLGLVNPGHSKVFVRNGAG
jgi:hypothetical protein